MRYRERIYRAYLSTRAGAAAATPEAALAPRAAYLARLVRRHFPADRAARIVDLGCGHGALLHFARQAGYTDLAGFDAAAEQVAAAAALGIEGVRQADAAAALAAMADTSCDVVVAFDVVEHLTRDELLDFADAIHRVLRPGGRWIIHAPNGESPFFGRIRYGDLTHELAFTRDSLHQLASAAGFREFAAWEDRPAVHGPASAARWLGWRVIRLGLRVWLAVETGESGRDAIFSQNLLAVAIK